jgi:hypothetical protein
VAAEELPHSVREFIGRFIRSVEQLEILLLLQREPARSWTVPEVYDVILSTVSSVEGWLLELVKQGFAEATDTSTPGYRYAALAENAVQISLVAEAYRHMPVRVIETIYKPARDPAQGFADAFRLRKRDSE